MSTRAAKRQKRVESPARNAATTDPESGSAGDEEEEEEVRSGAQRRNAKNTKLVTTPTRKKATAAATGRRQLVSRQKRGGLRQSELSFSKAVLSTTTKLSPLKSPAGSAQEFKENNGELEDDLIQDDDDEGGKASPRPPPFMTNASRQASFRSVGSQSSESSLFRRGSGRQTPFAAQGLAPKPLNQKKAVLQDAESHLPWAQRYAPRTLDDLGVHKRKVADVRGWLDNVLKGYEKKRLLVLRGPSGAGKTATVLTLARELGFSILEWKNPLGNSSAAGEYTSNTASLEDFLSRGQRYGSLDFENGGDTYDISKESSEAATDARRIILMEELPHVFTSNSTSLRNFRESILRYLLAEDSFFNSRDTQRARPPIVLIVSESSSSSATAPVDSLTAHRILGPEIVQHPRVTPIEFNPVATTILSKALETVLKRATQDGAAATQVSPAIMHKLAERGDLRAGISALEFMCLARSSSSSEPARPLGTTTKRGKAGSGKASIGKKNAVLTPSEAALVDAIAQRSTMLDLFHAVGKVMYNKRQPSTSDASILVSEVDIDALLDDSGTDTSTFVAALHENYALSCAGDSFIDTLNACTDALSDTDLLSGYGTASSFANTTDAASIRQADLAAHVAVQGLLHSLPYPVKRPTITSRDAFKMFWPESLRVRGRADEVFAATQRFLSHRNEASRTDSSRNMHLPCARGPTEAILEEVPYRALIVHARGGSVTENVAKELAAMVKLGNSMWGDTTVKDAGNNKRDLWKKKALTKEKEDDDDSMGSFIRGVDEKWVLSDDDIED